MKTEHKLTQNKWRLFMRHVSCIFSTPAAPALCRVRPKVKTVLFSLGLSTLQPVHPVSTTAPTVWVFYWQKMWIFQPENHHLAPILQKNWHMRWLHIYPRQVITKKRKILWKVPLDFLCVVKVQEARLAHLWFFVFTRGGLVPCSLLLLAPTSSSFTTHDLSFIMGLSTSSRKWWNENLKAKKHLNGFQNFMSFEIIFFNYIQDNICSQNCLCIVACRLSKVS